MERNLDLTFISEYELKDKNKFQFLFPSEAGKLFRENTSDILGKAIITESEFNKKQKSMLQELARLKVTSLLSGKDKLVLHAVYSLNELDETINLFLERIREWYSIHFPELVETIADNKNYIEFIIKIGNKSSYQQKKNLLSYEPTFNDELIDKSLGVELNTEDIS